MSVVPFVRRADTECGQLTGLRAQVNDAVNIFQRLAIERPDKLRLLMAIALRYLDDGQGG